MTHVHKAQCKMRVFLVTLQSNLNFLQNYRKILK